MIPRRRKAALAGAVAAVRGVWLERTLDRRSTRDADTVTAAPAATRVDIIRDGRVT